MKSLNEKIVSANNVFAADDMAGTTLSSCRIMTLTLLFGSALAAFANPNGMTVQSGSASAVANGNQLNITASHNAFLNWQSFNIGAGETTTFIQPSAQSIVWNRINDQNASQIYGNLNANGVVVLMNQSGFYFGPNSFVSAAGLVVSTAQVTPIDSGAGLFWQFNGAPPAARIVNYGQLNAGAAGSLFLIGNHIENYGKLNAPGGSIGLLSGQEVFLNTRPDGLGLGAVVKIPSGIVNNSGQLVADAGTIALNAQVVNQNGLVQANSVREHNGVIELVASDAVNLGAASQISAHGDSEGTSPGGFVTIKSDHVFSDTAGSTIDVAGGAQGGSGGYVQIFGDGVTANSVQSQLNLAAAPDSLAGRLLVNTYDLTLSSGTTDLSSASPTINYNDLAGFSKIALFANHDLTLALNPDGTQTTFALADTSDLLGTLTLRAGHDLMVQNTVDIHAGQNWSVSLAAGTSSAADAAGSLTFAGNSSLETLNGGISLFARNNVTVNSGFVHTFGGGSIDVRAVTGDINTGTSTAGFVNRGNGLTVNELLGGISTGNGGNVTLTAGRDVISFLPTGNLNTDAGSGAFGSAAGNVTVTAGRDVYGHFVVANGKGQITAGHDAGTANSTIGTKLLALSLIKGGWKVDAANDILLQEVRNPNGIYNANTTPTTLRHLFNYGADAYTILNAGHGVQLRGQGPRNSGTFEQSIPAIYPGTLRISAGAGGVTLANDVILFPSSVGQLSIATTDGGSLTGMRSGTLTQIIMSDSSRTQFRNGTDFGIADHAATPLHLNDLEPVRLDISGNLTGILLGVPKVAEINVVGDMINSRFNGQNLHDDDVTSINVGQVAKLNMESRGLLNPATDSGLYVGGNIYNRNEFTTTGSSAPNFDALNNAVEQPGVMTAAGWALLAARFSYNPATGQLTFQGRMTGDQLNALLHLQVPVLDQFGQIQYDAQGNIIAQNAQFASATVINDLYTRSQDVPSNPTTGYLLGGGGTFNINAHNFDLGSTAGVVSQGPRGNSALAKYFTHGANINVNLSGYLDMFSTTISSLNGGAVSVYSDSYINVGSSAFSGNDLVARGIFTLDDDDVSVIAVGDINVAGSRIAAYDGGDVHVKSLTGNVNAGTGASGSVPVEKYYVNPDTRRVSSYAPTIPGSGILATTFPPSLDPSFPSSTHAVGNILVETPRGNINASAGGVVQIPLNGVNSDSSTVTLIAGTKHTEIGPDGKPVTIVDYVGNIDASGSGVIGSTVKLDATGDVKGFVFARNNIDVTAVQNVSVTALAQGDVSVGAGGNISGTIIGVGSVSASGGSVDASLLSQNVTSSGGTSGQIGFAQGDAAGATSQSMQKDDGEKIAADSKGNAEDDELKKKGAVAPRLTRTVGRVTVILPKS